MNVMRRILLLPLLFMQLIAFTQTHRIDSLYKVLKTQQEDTARVNTLNKLAYAFSRCDCDSTGKKFDSLTNASYALAEKLNYLHGKAEALIYKGANLSLKEPMKAIEKLQNALSVSETLQDTNLIYRVNSSMSRTYYAMGNFSADAVYAYRNLKIAEKKRDSAKIAETNNSLGNVYSDEQDYRNAMKYHGSALKYQLRRNDSLRISHGYVNLGIDYLGALQYDSAILYSKKALAIQVAKHNKVGQAYSFLTIATAYIDRKDYKAALGYLLPARIFLMKYDDNMEKADVSISLGDVYVKLKNYDSAFYFYSEAKVVAEENKIVKHLVNCYRGLSDVYEAKHNKDSALKYYKLYASYKDSVFSNDKAKSILSLTYKYNYDKEEDVRRFNDEKKELAHEAAINRQRLIIIMVSVGLLLVLVFAIVLFNRFRLIRKQKEIIEIKSKETEEQKKAVEERNHIIEEKNKDILDSITYAKRLQDAILPPVSIIQKYLPESFVLYKPKDIVAGDFYWIAPISPEGGISANSKNPPSEGREAILIAAADCTGHGVPGALVSVVCSNALNRTVKEFKITEPGKILDKARELVIETFEKSEGSIQDGMDISLASLTPSEGGIQVRWAGAFNSLWYIESGEMKEIAADKQPIGKTDNPKLFTTHEIKLNPPSEGREAGALYLFTDGYADQFGGPKGKKFKYKQFQELLLANSNKSMEEQKQLLESAIEEWMGGLEQVDDILVIGIRV